MKRFPYVMLFILIFVLACGGMPLANPTITASPESTTTFTPSPTETPTLVPTATVDVPATKAAQDAQEAEKLKAELDKLIGDTDIPYQDGYLAWRSDGPISINLNGPDNRLNRFDDKLTLGNFVLKSDIKWKATGIIICGVIFRSDDDLILGKQYDFVFLRLSGLPAWAIQVYEFGKFKNSPTNVKYSSAVNQGNDATNQIVLAVHDDSFTIFINGIRQGRYFDYSKQRTDGKFGFIGSQDSGKGSCTFSNSWIWSIDPPNFSPNT